MMIMMIMSKAQSQRDLYQENYCFIVLIHLPLSHLWPPMRIHVLSTAWDIMIISFNGQDNFVFWLVQSEETFQTIPEWAQISQGHRRKR